jgi:tetratricopeptide (TPR) repeat protein
LPSDSFNYAGADRAARLGRAGGARRAGRPRMLSTAGYLLTTGAMAALMFAGVWWLFVTAGDEAPWLPAAAAGSIVLLVSIAAREVLVRRAWARYTHGLEMEMSRGEQARAAPVALRQPPPPPKASVRASSASLRALQQRLAQAEEAGARQPEAHLEAYKLCEQYLASTEDAMRGGRASTEVRVALRAGQERVRELQKHHLLAWVRGEAQRLTQEARRRASVSGRIETAQRALEVIGEALRLYPEEPELRDSAAAVRDYVASVKVAHWVELGERAAFRGRFNRAVARYRDALFYLARAEMSEDAREDAAARINREIEMLRARIAMGEGEAEAGPRRRRKQREGAAGRADD